VTQPITAFAYLEEEARREESDIRMKDRPPIRMPSRVRSGGFQPMPMATLTPEQARAAGWELYKALVGLDQVLAERGQLTDAVIVNVWGGARAAVRHASKATPEESSDGVARQLDADAKEETAPAAGGSPQEGSGGEAGDA
jgi:hypothetical protein